MPAIPAAENDYEFIGGASIKVIAYDQTGYEEHQPRDLHEARGIVRRRRVTWINVDSVSDPQALRALEKDFGIHPLTVEDIGNLHQRPKVEEYDAYTYVVFQMVRRGAEGDLLTEQVSILFGDDWVITLQDRPGDVFDGVRNRIRAVRPRISAGGPDYLVYALADAIVDAFFPVLEQLGLKAETLEDNALEHATLEMREDLQALRRDLLLLRRLAFPQRDAVGMLERGELKRITRETRTYLRDVSDHATRVLDMVETNRELAASLMDLYLASLQQRSNEVMKVLTLVATIFIPLTFIVGVYGMNFEYMPELEWVWGYPAVMIFMAGLGTFMYVLFRRRGWV